MKNVIFLGIFALGVCLISACSGDHSSTNGEKNKEKNTYGVAKDTSKVDTSKINSTDYSASGGTKVDTPKKPAPKK
jgi:hypothetical protein